MAKKQNAKKAGTGTSHNRDDDFATPEGFTINAGRERGDGWAIKEEGNEIMGRLLGRQTYKTRRGKTRAFYQIKLQKPCMAEVENPNFNEEADEDEDNQPRIRQRLEEGDTVNIDEFKKLEDLEPYTKDGGVYDVWFVMGGKVELGEDQTMWTLAAGPKLRVVQKPEKD